MTKKASLIIGLILGGAVFAPAAWSGSLPDFVSKMISIKKYRLVDSGDSSVSGVKYYVLKRGLKNTVIFGLGNYVITGGLLDASGKNVLFKEYTGLMSKYSTDLGEFIRDLKKSYKVIWMGGLRPEVILLVDPNDSASKGMIQEIPWFVKEYGAKVGVVLVPAKTSTSFAVADEIMRSQNPVQEVLRFAKMKHEPKKLKNRFQVSKASSRYFDNLRSFLIDSGIEDVPTIFYRSSDTGKWNFLVGDRPLSAVGRLLNESFVPEEK